MRAKQDFDKELGEARGIHSKLGLEYESKRQRMAYNDVDRVYSKLNSVEQLLVNLDRPVGHPDVKVSKGVKEARDSNLDTAKTVLEEVGKILSKYQTDSEQPTTPRGPRLVARTARYALDDKGNYYAMTDGRKREIVLSSDTWKAGDVPVRISSEITPVGLSQKIKLEVVSGVPSRQYPVKVEHIDQDGDPFFVYEDHNERGQIMVLNPDRGKWKGTVEENFVDFNLLPTDVQMALIGEQEWQRRRDRRRAEFRSSYGGDGF